MDSQDSNLAQINNRKTEFLITSFALYFCNIAYGLAYNIWGPTWVDLVSLLDSSQDKMAYGNSLMAIGYTIGAFSGGFLFNCMNRQLLISFYLILIAISTTLTPIVKSYEIFLVFSVIFGLGEGGFDTGCNAWILEMWQNENGPYMQAMYFTFGLGSLLAPLISFKFLADNIDFAGTGAANGTTVKQYPTLANMTLNSGQLGAHHHNFIYSTKLLTPLTQRFNGWLNITSNDNTTSGINTSEIYIPYCITGGLLVVSALIIIIMYFIKKYEPISDNSDTQTNDQMSRKSSIIESNQLNEDTDRAELLNNNNYGSKQSVDLRTTDQRIVSKQYLYFMVLMGGIMFCFYEGMENINFEYLETFYVNTKLSLSEDTSDLIASSMSAAYTIGRGIGILVAIKVEPKYFLYCDIILISIANAILYLFADKSETMVIIGTVILGLGFSTVFPCIYSYLERQIRLTNVICGILQVSCASIATVDPIIVGRYIKDYPYILLYVNIGSTILVIIAFMTIEITSQIRNSRTKRIRSVVDDNNSDIVIQQ